MKTKNFIYNMIKEFKLSTPLQTKDLEGNINKEYNVLYLSEPIPSKHRMITARLKQTFLSGMQGMQTKVMTDTQQPANVEKDEKEGEVDATTMKAFIYCCKDLDIDLFYNNFEKLLLNNVCFYDQDCKQQVLKKHIQDDLSFDDYENLIATYLASFFFTSWMTSLS